MAITILVLSQVFFTASDLLARSFLHRHGFSVATFLMPWFILYWLFRIAATFGQLYVLSQVEVGKTLALFGAASIILANLLGFLLLKEVLSPTQYGGITLAVIAFIILSFK